VIKKVYSVSEAHTRFAEMTGLEKENIEAVVSISKYHH
jgi:hypothetical protein